METHRLICAAALLTALGLVLPGYLYAESRVNPDIPERGGYRYYEVPLSKVKTTARTHVCTSGFVVGVHKNDDGDRHVNLAATKNGSVLVVAEIIPTVSRVRSWPTKGDNVRVCGITRFDKQHKWPEIHPVESWRPIQ